MTNFKEILKRLNRNKVEFILIGGLAAIAHGSTSATSDLDIVYKKTAENIKKIILALGDLHVRLRGAPPDLPFIFDDKSFSNTINFTLQTDLGAVDLLGEIPGFDSYQDIVTNTDTLTLFDTHCLVLSLKALIKNKRATGRRKDLNQLDELEELLKMKNQTSEVATDKEK